MPAKILLSPKGMLGEGSPFFQSLGEFVPEVVTLRSNPSDPLPKNIASSTLVPMPALNPAPELFEIEAASPETAEPENQTYVIRMRMQGPYEVRSFLSNNGVDERRIAFAIAELGRSRLVNVKKQADRQR